MIVQLRIDRLVQHTCAVTSYDHARKVAARMADDLKQQGYTYDGAVSHAAYSEIHYANDGHIASVRIERFDGGSRMDKPLMAETDAAPDAPTQ